MGFLTRVFGNMETVANSAVHDDERFHEVWSEYLASFEKKLKLSIPLRQVESIAPIVRIRELINTELVEIQHEEHFEREVIADLELIEHKHKVRRIQILKNFTRDDEGFLRLIFRLLEEVYNTLRAQLHLTNRILRQFDPKEKLCYKLALQIHLEEQIVARFNRTSEHHNELSTIAKGVHAIRRLDAEERKLINEMRPKMEAHMFKGLEEGMLYEWIKKVYDAIMPAISQAVETGIIEEHDPFGESIVVNRPEFIDVVRNNKPHGEEQKITEPMVVAFTHLYTELFNEATYEEFKE